MYINSKDCENENIIRIIVMMRIIISVIMVMTGERVEVLRKNVKKKIPITSKHFLCSSRSFVSLLMFINSKVN